MYKNIVITGASSGIGAALAQRLALPGVNLGLVGRNSMRLEEVAMNVEACGARTSTGSADISDQAAIEQFISQFEARAPIDLLIVNAGIFDGCKPNHLIEDLNTAIRVINTNLIGTLNTIHAALPGMQQRGEGHIVIVSSLAAMMCLKGALAHSASKSALLIYAQGLCQTLRPLGIKVTLVLPGFIETELTNHYIGIQPFRISADEAAVKIIRAIRANRKMVAFPKRLYILARILPFVPNVFSRMLMEWFACHSKLDQMPTIPREGTLGLDPQGIGKA